MTATSNRTPELDLDRVARYLTESVPDLHVAEISASLIAGGRSNLTFALDVGSHRWVLRRPPLGHVLETAHDMAREYRAIEALASSVVPVPQPVVYCSDAGVIGAPFYVMSRLEGRIFREPDQLAPLGPKRARAISTRLVDTLADLHSLDPAELGLEDFGRPEGYLQRQVRRWSRQLESSRSRPLAGADELVELLQRTPPPTERVGLVHGDYKLDNLMIDDSDQVVGILDWEMATLGDPVTDLALLAVYRRLGELPNQKPDAYSAPGFLTFEEMLERYRRRVDVIPAHMAFYLGLAHFKLAAIAESIHFRHISGLTSGDGFDAIGELTQPLIRAGVAAIRGEL